MAAMIHNHANYQQRLDFIQDLLTSHVGLSPDAVKDTKITPIQYEPHCPFKYNNFVYHISLPSPTNTLGVSDKEAIRPGCVTIPEGTNEFIIRLSNPDAEGLHQETRVQNEVGILNLASEALAHVKPAVVPRVFGWGARTGMEDLGWILQEKMPGVPLAEAFSEMSLGQKRGILGQMADLLKGLQDYDLPESIRGWGGVTYGDNGLIVSAPMTTVGAGPWSSLEDSFRGRFKEVLRRTDLSSQLQGWRNNGIRERVDRFVEHGLMAQFAGLTSKGDRSIVHGDFTTDNLLYDPKIGQITALSDYDFACIQHPAHEFFSSFATSGGTLSGWSPEPEALSFQQAKTSGRFPSPLPSQNDAGFDWEVAQAWEDELLKRDVKRPSSFQEIDKVADVEELLGLLYPWQLTNEDSLRRNPDEEKRKASRRTSEKQLVDFLEHLGF